MYGTRLVVRRSMLAGIVIGHCFAVDLAFANPTFVQGADISVVNSVIAVAAAQHDSATTRNSGNPGQVDAWTNEHRSVAMGRDSGKLNGQDVLAFQDVDFRRLNAASSERVSTTVEGAKGMAFPEPGSLSAIISTITLALFFFLRRASE